MSRFLAEIKGRILNTKRDSPVGQSPTGDLCDLNPDDCTLCRAILAVLRSEDYFIVQETIVYLESNEDRLEIEAFTNMRDALHHLALAATPDLDPLARRHQLSEVYEHLRRGMTHPFQDAIDRRLGELESRQRFYFVRAGIFSDVLLGREYRERITSAKQLLAEARKLKGHNRIPETASLLKDCYEILVRTKMEATPSRQTFVFRLILIVLGMIVAGLVGGFIASVFFSV